MGRRQLFRAIAIACLALLVALLLRLDWSQVALSWNRPTFNILTNRPTSAGYMPANEFREEQKLVAANYEDAVDEAKKQFICFKASKKYSIPEFKKLKPEIIQTTIVSHLANELSDCVRQNRRNIDFVDPKNLFRVIYTTKLLQDSNETIIIVGAGSPAQIPERARFSEGIVDFLTANTNGTQSSITLSNNDVNNKEFTLIGCSGKDYCDWSIGSLGKLLIQSKGKINVPNKLSLTGNGKSSVNTFLRISHKPELEGSNREREFPFFDLRLYAQASELNKNLLSNARKELARTELTFSGLLLKGIPIYLKYREDKMKEDKFIDKVDTDTPPSNRATLLKKIELSNSEKLEELRKIENKLAQSRTQQDKNELKNLVADKVKLLESIYKVDFPCAPAFTRTINFPIFEKSTSSSTGSSSSSSGSVNTSAGVGVRGNVVIDINNPKCIVTIVPPYNVKSTTYADISVTSSGLFGARARAEATKEGFINFKDKYGTYTFKQEDLSKLSDEEKDYIGTVIEKSLKENEVLISKVAENIEGKFVIPLLTSDKFRNALVRKLSGRDKVLELCKKHLSSLGENASGVCWANEMSPEQAVEQARTVTRNFLSKLPAPTRERLYEEIITQVCKNSLSPRVCRKLSGTITKVDREVNRELPRKILEWENKIKERHDHYKNLTASAVEHYVRNSILSPANAVTIVNSQDLARKLLKQVWKVEKGVHKANEVVELISNPLQLDILKEPISIKASASADFQSKAHIIETRPAFQLDSTLVFPGNKPALRVKSIFNANYKDQLNPDKRGRSGGLEILDLILRAKLVADVAGEEVFTIPDAKDQQLTLIDTPVFDPKSIDLNKEKHERTDEISLSFSR
jgi:ribosomal protein L29